MSRTPVVSGFPAIHATWRHIAGHDFQVVQPYVLAAMPDRTRPHLTLWLRKISRPGEAALWSAKVVRGVTPVNEHRGLSAGHAVRSCLADPTWTAEPAPELSGQRTAARDPYPDNYSVAPAGWYADRASAHDGRWDSPSGVL